MCVYIYIYIYVYIYIYIYTYVCVCVCVCVSVCIVPRPNSRTDIDQVRNNLMDGSNLRSIIETARSVQSIKIAETWLKYNETPRTWKPEIRGGVAIRTQDPYLYLIH